MAYKIEVVGLGAGDMNQLPVGVYRKLVASRTEVFARTLDHPVISQLIEEGVSFKSFDELYEAESNFEKVYEKLTRILLEKAEERPIVYAVPGHPMLAEKTVQLLLEQSAVEIDIIGGHSYLDDMFTALKIDPIDGFQLIDATSFTREQLNFSNNIVFCQVYDKYTASHVKLTLLEDLPADYEVVIVDAAGTAFEKVITVPLEDLDRQVNISNLMSVYVPPVPNELLNHTFHRLKTVIATLRGEDGCPWDRSQTHETLRPYAVEEVYELIDAINREDDEGIIEELGDVLLQVMLHSQIGEDNGYFSIDDVIRSITEKMIHRHPAVFAKDKQQKTWDELKLAEKPAKENDLLLDSIVKEAPALLVSQKMQRKVAKVGFNWSNVDEVWEKLQEEKEEFFEAVGNEDTAEMEKEFGDMLFVLANIANFYELNPELALQRANEKFISRFNYIETKLKQENIKVNEASFDLLEQYWQEAKQKE